MPKLAWNLVAVGCVAASVAAAPARAFEYNCTEGVVCPNVLCSGDDPACERLQVRQDEVNYETGAHFVIFFHVPADWQPKTMNVMLRVGDKTADCAGSLRESIVNVSNDDSRSIDGGGLQCAGHLGNANKGLARGYGGAHVKADVLADSGGLCGSVGRGGPAGRGV